MILTFLVLGAIVLGSLWFLNRTRMWASIRCTVFNDYIACLALEIPDPGIEQNVQDVLRNIGNSI